jgi:hypothetical protein
MANNIVYANDGDFGTTYRSGIGAIMQGASGMVMLFTLKDTGGTAIALTGYTVTGKMEAPDGTVAAITGAIAVTGSAASGEFGWTVASADTEDYGNFKIWFTFVKAVSPTYVSFPAGLAIVENKDVSL